MEKGPSFNYTHQGVEREARRDNTVLYTFMGKLAVYNHVFFTFDQEEGKPQQGLYIYKSVLPDMYTRAEEFIVDNEFPQYLNLLEVSEVDQVNLHRVLARDLVTTDTIPEEWLNGEA